MHEYELRLLKFLSQNREAAFDALPEKLGLGQDQLLWTVENLSKRNAVSVKTRPVKDVVLSDEGREDINGFPEEKLVKKIADRGRVRISEIKDQVALSWAKKNGWISIGEGDVTLTEAGEKAADGGEYDAHSILNKLHKASPEEAVALVSKNRDLVDNLTKRGLVEIKDRNVVESISITKAGEDLLAKNPEEEGIGALTKKIIASGEWKHMKFRPYDINAPVDAVYPGRLHPLREFINVVRSKWLEMGFVEVSGPIIESAFWNFDALFSPQDHPTREMQDTFFLANPKQLTIEDIEVMERVKKMHTTGWKEKWSEEVARSAVLRTHTTSVSARYMHKLASTIDANYPLKLFSVGSVFRNESVDYKHMAELHMYDGIIVGDNLTFANLIDTLRKFYSKLGLDNVKLRPSYFPFTEPSLEAYYYDEEHGDSIELTGGGIIRKEITKAMGINKTVLAWGGGIDRLLLNNRILGLDSLLTAYKNDIGWLRTRGNLRVWV
jgi:phenylalanyl-tRNA synthetase alpha chain